MSTICSSGSSRELVNIPLRTTSHRFMVQSLVHQTDVPIDIIFCISPIEITNYLTLGWLPLKFTFLQSVRYETPMLYKCFKQHSHSNMYKWHPWQKLQVSHLLSKQFHCMMQCNCRSWAVWHCISKQFCIYMTCDDWCIFVHDRPCRCNNTTISG